MSRRGGGRGDYWKNYRGRGGGRGGGRGRGRGVGGGYRGGGSWRRGGGGRGGGGRFKQEDSQDFHSSPAPGASAAAQSGSQNVLTKEVLTSILRRIDNKQFGAYKDLYQGSQGSQHYDMGGMRLIVDYVQSDPYAASSRFRVQVPTSASGFPEESYKLKIRNVALCDFLTRRFHDVCRSLGADARSGGQGWHGAKGGDLRIDCPGQHVIERTSVNVSEKFVESRFCVGLPAQGRKIMGSWALDILTRVVPEIAKGSLFLSAIDQNKMWEHIHSVEDQESLRSQLDSHGLVAFVVDGAILPRTSGNSDKPMDSAEAVPFQSPDSLRVSFTLPNRGQVIGMGIRKGITLIVGGGFHGKSTVLSALQLGVYNHIPGDGREFVSSVDAAVKIRAEDGRSISAVDISSFINNLPFGKGTDSFSSADASGSTSQAANIMEALEVGASCLLVDEDTSATNFMIRDERMQRLVPAHKEPITPFVHKIRSLRTHNDVSSVLVIGGTGSYFDVADCVIMMDSYRPIDVTKEALAISGRGGNVPQGGVTSPTAMSDSDSTSSLNDEGAQIPITPRVPVASSLDQLFRGDRLKTKVLSKQKISFGYDELDLGCVEQIGEESQTRAIVQAMLHMKHTYMDNKATMSEIMRDMQESIGTEGLDVLSSDHMRYNGSLALPRRFEIACALNRWRVLKFRTVSGATPSHGVQASSSSVKRERREGNAAQAAEKRRREG